MTLGSHAHETNDWTAMPSAEDNSVVMDAFVAYMQAQARYLQAMMRPMTNPLIFAFGKTNTAVLDTFSKQANDQLSILEKIAQDFIQSA
jgi:hypothetical protein